MEEAVLESADPGLPGPEKIAPIEPNRPEGALPVQALGRALTAFLPKGDGQGVSFSGSHVSGQVEWARGTTKRSWWSIGGKLYYFKIGTRWWNNSTNFPGGVIPDFGGAAPAKKAAAPPPPRVDDKSDAESSCDEENPDAEPQPDPLPAEEAALLHSGMLSPHGQVWVVHPTGPTVDVRASMNKNFKARLRLKTEYLDIQDATALDV
ncbi:hypothetical protein T484DRAFT_1861174 [Baffinella frigidus]|nr:hypothetical protein T484DRAFT_1861174 [Cryptophyta sp. CCMP2293]